MMQPIMEHAHFKDNPLPAGVCVAEDRRSPATCYLRSKKQGGINLPGLNAENAFMLNFFAIFLQRPQTQTKF